MVREISGGLHFGYTRQSEALGLGHAVLTARELVGDEPFAVLLGDVIMDGKIPSTRSLVEIYEATGVGAIAVEEVPRERLHFYGIVDAAPEKQKKIAGAIDCCGSRIWSRSRSRKRRRQISASRDAMCCRRKFLITSRKQSRAWVVKFS